MSESNISQNTNTRNDEIDLFELLARLWKEFKKILGSILNIVRCIIFYLLRKSLWIASFALVGAIAGYVLYKISRPYYASSLEGHTGSIDNTVVIDHINNLATASATPDLLASFLGISEEQALEIRSIKAYYGIDTNRDGRPDYVDIDERYNPRDTNMQRVPSRIYIHVSICDEDLLPVLRKGLFQYVNTNAYLQKLFNIDRQQRNSLLAEIETEIGKVDSLQQVYVRKQAKTEAGQLLIMGNEPELKLFYSDVLKLYEQKQSLERHNAVYDEIIITVQDFIRSQQRENKALHYIIFYALLMVVAGLIFVLLRDYRKTIWKLLGEDPRK